MIFIYQKHIIGKEGEDIATKYLENDCYKIIERNFQSRSGEIDIIAFDNKKEEIVFFEVKTRTNKKYGNPVDAVNKIKQSHIFKTAKYYIYIHNLYDEKIRFDIIEIFLTEKIYRINHIKQII